MTMQRRHFELIAEIIAKELDGEHREKAAYAFAYALPITNGNFDSQRFLKACKVSEKALALDREKTSGASRRGSLTFCNNFAVCSFSAKT
jgi:hypothetical protein